MFFEEKKPKNRVDTDQDLIDWSSKLFAALAHKGKVDNRSSMKTWRKQLLALKGKNKDLVDRVLDWYVKHIGNEFVPIAYSAQSFVSKFHQIEAAMNSSDDVPSEVISERNKTRAELLLLNYTFPVEIESLLPILVQRTDTNWENFCKAMERKRNITKEARLHCFLNYVLDQSGGFLDNWFLFLSTKFGYLDNYSGNVLSLAYKQDSIRFRDSFWRLWSKEWCSNPTAFDSLWEELVK